MAVLAPRRRDMIKQSLSQGTCNLKGHYRGEAGNQGALGELGDDDNFRVLSTSNISTDCAF